MRPSRLTALASLAPLLLTVAATDARTVYRCVRGASVSLSTAAEPGSRCKALELDNNTALSRPLMRKLGLTRGVLYRREQNGRTVYGTRKLPGSVAVQKFAIPARTGSARRGRRASLGPPRLDVYAEQFRSASRSTGTDEAWLRAIAHVESGYNPRAVSPKGARGIMQLMPTTAKQQRVTDPFDASQSIHAGARLLRTLSDQYKGDRVRVAAAYNAGPGAVERYGGVPPYAETRDYVGKVLALHARYRAALQAAGRAKAQE